MRKQDKAILWPAYFDATKTRMEGRRVPKTLAVPSPKLEELQRAAEGKNLHPEVFLEAKYPKRPWQKTGKVVVPKKGLKTKMIREIAEELLNMRRKV